MSEEIKNLEAERDTLAARVQEMREALKFYADQEHFIPVDPQAWDSVSGEPENFLEDEANTVTIEDGSVAKRALATPDNSAQILARLKAATWMEAAEVVAAKSPEMSCQLAAGAFRAKADDLLNGLGKKHEQPL